MDTGTSTALIAAVAAIAVAVVNRYGRKRVERVAEQAEHNRMDIEVTKVSIDVLKSRAELAEKDAERYRRERDHLARWVERARRECPELGDINPYVREPQDVVDQDGRGD
jgi:hypothetical protein